MILAVVVLATIVAEAVAEPVAVAVVVVVVVGMAVAVVGAGGGHFHHDDNNYLTSATTTVGAATAAAHNLHLWSGVWRSRFPPAAWSHKACAESWWQVSFVEPDLAMMVQPWSQGWRGLHPESSWQLLLLEFDFTKLANVTGMRWLGSRESAESVTVVGLAP